MNELSLLDYLALRLRFWRMPPEGVPTLRQLWREEGAAHAAEPATEEAAPKRRSVRWRRPEIGDGPAPLGIVSALALAFVAQMMLTGGEPAVAVVLFAGAAGAGLLAVRRGEIPPAVTVEGDSGSRTESRLRPFLGAAAIVAAVITGAMANGNRAGVVVLLCWISAVGLATAALTTSPGDQGRLWSAIRARFGQGRWSVALRWPLFLLVFLIGAAVFVRTMGLATVPAEMISIHAELLRAMHAVFQPEPLIVFPSSAGGFQPIPIYLGTLLAPLTGGLSFAGLKLGTLLASLITLPLIYLLGQEIGGRSTGFCALALAAVGQWPDLVSRLGFTGGWYPPIAAATVLLLLRAIRRQRRGDFVAVGIVIGLGLQTHPMARSLLPLAVILVVLGMIPAGSAERRRLVIGLGVALVLTGITGLPTIMATPEPPTASGELWWLGAAGGDRDGKVAEDLLERAGRTLSLPLWSDGPAWFHGGGDRPALDRVAASLLVLGAAVVAAAAAFRRRYTGLLLLVAVPILMLPAILSPVKPEMAPSLLWCGGAIAPIFVLAGIGLASLASAIVYSLTAPIGRRLAGVAAAILIGFSAVAGRMVVQGPFAEAWDGATWNASELGEVVRSAIALGVSDEHARVVPFPHWVDTRLVAVEAGFPGRDLAVKPDELERATRWPGPQIFLIHPNDHESLAILEDRLPAATTTRHLSRVEGKDFLSITVLPTAGGI